MILGHTECFMRSIIRFVRKPFFWFGFVVRTQMRTTHKTRWNFRVQARLWPNGNWNQRSSAACATRNRCEHRIESTHRIHRRWICIRKSQWSTAEEEEHLAKWKLRPATCTRRVTVIYWDMTANKQPTHKHTHTQIQWAQPLQLNSNTICTNRRLYEQKRTRLWVLTI